MPIIYKLRVAPEANAEIREAFSWIALQNREAALKWRQDLRAKMGELSHFPKRYPFAPEYRLGFTAEVTRQFLFGRSHWKYRVMFVIEEDAVIIVHIRHGARRFVGEDAPEDSDG